MDWLNNAACLDKDPELFFPVGSSRAALAQTEQAKAVCNSCTVVQNCLTWALKTHQECGVWGALSEDERRKIKVYR